jgi:hypothetical protein
MEVSKVCYVEDFTLSRHSAGGEVDSLLHWMCALLPLGIFVVLISVGGSFNQRAIMRLEQLGTLN